MAVALSCTPACAGIRFGQSFFSSGSIPAKQRAPLPRRPRWRVLTNSPHRDHAELGEYATCSSENFERFIGPILSALGTPAPPYCSSNLSSFLGETSQPIRLVAPGACSVSPCCHDSGVALKQPASSPPTDTRAPRRQLRLRTRCLPPEPWQVNAVPSMFRLQLSPGCSGRRDWYSSVISSLGAMSMWPSLRAIEMFAMNTTTGEWFWTTTTSRPHSMRLNTAPNSVRIHLLYTPAPNRAIAVSLSSLYSLAMIVFLLNSTMCSGTN